MTRKLLALMFLSITAAAMVACNTTRGAGRDLEKGGDAIERSAERHGADR